MKACDRHISHCNVHVTTACHHKIYHTQRCRDLRKSARLRRLPVARQLAGVIPALLAQMHVHAWLLPSVRATRRTALTGNRAGARSGGPPGAGPGTRACLQRRRGGCGAHPQRRPPPFHVSCCKEQANQGSCWGGGGGGCSPRVWRQVRRAGRRRRAPCHTTHHPAPPAPHPS